MGCILQYTVLSVAVVRVVRVSSQLSSVSNQKKLRRQSRRIIATKIICSYLPDITIGPDQF